VSASGARSGHSCRNGPPTAAPSRAARAAQVMKPVLTPVRHGSQRRRHRSLDSTPGQMRLQLPTRYAGGAAEAAAIKLQQCVVDGVAALEGVQKAHAQLVRKVPCALQKFSHL
jgi:hypothetical protein